MNKMERHKEIIRILRGRGRETMANLAKELRVNIRTIRRDILELTADAHYPIDTYLGNGGGVVLNEWRHPHKGIFSREQQTVLAELMTVANKHQAEVLRGLLDAYGTPIKKEG